MTLEDWYQEIEKSPHDWDLRRVFSDWLEEQGLEVLARGQRWQIEHRRCPLRTLKKWGWYSWTADLTQEITSTHYPQGVDLSELSLELVSHLSCLEKGTMYGEGNMKARYADTLQEVEKALALALALEEGHE